MFLFSLQTISGLRCAKRERERDCEPPQTELQSDDPHSADPPTVSFLHSDPPFSLIHPLFHFDPPKTDLVLNPPKTELVRRVMPKAPVSRPLHFFLFKLNPKPRNPENPFLKPTTPTNPFRKPIS